MSLTKSATIRRRLSLLAGSSLVAAALSAATFTLAPTVALAANECAPVGVDPSANGPTADARTCTGAATYQTSGITYASEGNLTVTASGAMNVGAVGINLTGANADTVGFSANNILTGTSGPVVDIVSNSGAITVSAAGVVATAPGVTHAFQLQSTGGGNISYTKTGANAASLVSNDVAGGLAVVSAITNGGNITMSMTSGAQAGSGVVGRQRGFLAQTSGAGSVAVTIGGAQGMTISTIDGVAAVDATAGSGGLTVTVGNNSLLSGGAGLAIRGVATGAATISNTGTIGVADTNAIGGYGGGVNLSGVTGGVTFNNTGAGRWLASGASVLSGSSDTLNMTGTGQNQMAGGSSIDFGAGADTFSLTGALTVNGGTLTNLETFNNSGVIYLGGFGSGYSNGIAGDVLSAPGTDFVASGASRFVMDVSFGAGGQAGCAGALAADCVDFTGGSTSGTTLLTIVDADGSAASGAASRTTLIAGSSAVGDFALDPASAGYVTTPHGPALRRRLYDFYLVYDAAADQHVLASAPHVEAFQIATLPAAAQDIWRATSGGWFDRQVELRAASDEPSRGLWARAGAGVGERDSAIALTLLGADFGQTVSYDQRIAHITAGADLLAGEGWTAGLSLGLARGDTEYENPRIEATYAGVAASLYAGWSSGPVFIDASVSANSLEVNAEADSLNFLDSVKLAQTIVSLGGQVQAGWRFQAGEGMFVEPLVHVAYVRSDVDDIDTPGNAGTFDFGDGVTSLRAGAGLRLGLDTELMGVAANLSLTGRYWAELEGENAVVLQGDAPIRLIDDLGGDLGEVGGSLSLFGDGGVSGFVNLGGRFSDGYQSVDGAVGVRVRW